MKIAVDKNTINAANSNNEYIYLFDNEPIEDLINTGLHCINYKYCNFVDINLTDFQVNCIKKSKITDKDYDKLPTKDDYKFAIIVPNYNNNHGDYNGKTFFQNCIESILNQTYKNFELIIVDDMSTDTSVETIKSYKDSRIHLIQNKRKRYNGGSRNVGIEYALDNLDFDYFCFLDSDDWWINDKVLETINHRLYNHELMTLGVQTVHKPNENHHTRFNEAQCYEDLWSLNNNVWCTAWDKVIRKDKIVYFCESTLMEDRVWTYRLADNINFENVVNLKEICYVWNRLNTTNSVSQVRNYYWNASAYCHIGHQLQLISELKHKEMIPLIEKRIEQCKSQVNSGIYAQD
jgi:glycosyltransferase involved in cell wall biosynthesis